MLKPLEIPPLTAEDLETLENLYRTTKEVRLRAALKSCCWLESSE